MRCSIDRNRRGQLRIADLLAIGLIPCCTASAQMRNVQPAVAQRIEVPTEEAEVSPANRSIALAPSSCSGAPTSAAALSCTGITLSGPDEQNANSIVFEDLPGFAGTTSL